MPAEKVPEFLELIHRKVLGLGGDTPQLTPAVPVDESYTDDYIVCLEDGKKVTLLRRYLQKNFGLTSEEYLEKWDLPEDYPMVTKAYSAKRSKIAKEQGLGKS